MTTWYSSKGSGGQGLVIEQDTGRNVAVAYDEKDAALLAAAPRLLKLAREVVKYCDREPSEMFPSAKESIYITRLGLRRLTLAVIAEAEGQ